MESWIGPAVVAVVISSLVHVAGWFVTYRRELSLESVRRKEKVIDVQTALRAEIRSYRHGVNAPDLSAEADDTVGKIMDRSGAAFVPFVPRTASPVIFEAIVGDIHILPTSVIDAVVLHYKQRAVVGALVDDLRSDAFAKLEADRKARMYRQYADLRAHALLLADNALESLDRELRDDQ